MDNLVVIQNKQVVVSSRKVAESFNKMHKHVLASIKHLINSAEKSAQWFKQRSYKDSSGKSNIEYLMNRNGFMLLVMGFNGKTAIEMKIAYINAFDEMEAKLEEEVNAYFVGEAIKKARLQQNLTQEELGERIGVKKSQISKLENGRCIITLPTMSRIFRALGITTASLDLGTVGKITLW